MKMFDREKIIILDGRVSMDTEPKKFIDKFSDVFSTKDSYNSLVIDLTKAVFIYPSALIFILSLKEALAEDEIEITMKIEEGGELHWYLHHCGAAAYFSIPIFEKKEGVELKSEHSTVFPLKKESAINDTNKTAIEIVSIIKKAQDMTDLVEARTIDSIDEILRNISQHSSYSEYLILGQTYPQTKRIRYVFYDNGMGIKKHLTREPYDSTHNYFKNAVSRERYEEIKRSPANEAIKEASIDGVTASKNLNINSGAGLNFLLKELIPVTDGAITIVSGDGYVQWEKDQIKHDFSLPFQVPGTLISLVINCEDNTQLIYNTEVTVI